MTKSSSDGMSTGEGIAVMALVQMLSSLFGGKDNGQQHAMDTFKREMEEQFKRKIEEERAHNAAKEQERQAEIAKAKTELHAALENARRLQDDLTASNDQKAAAEAATVEARKRAEIAERPRQWVRMPPDELLAQAQSKLASKGLVLDPARVNIAVTGINGAGKSSLIKALLINLGGKSRQDPGLPRVSAVEAGNLEMAKYDVPGLPLTLWDCPGGNSERHPAASYVEDCCLAVFHMQIICLKDRFEQLHKDLLMAQREKYPHQRVFVVNCRAEVNANQYIDEAEQRGAGVPSFTQAVEHVRAAHRAEASAHGYDLSPDKLFIFSTNVVSGYVSTRFPVGAPMDEARFAAEMAMVLRRM